MKGWEGRAGPRHTSSQREECDPALLDAVPRTRYGVVLVDMEDDMLTNEQLQDPRLIEAYKIWRQYGGGGKSYALPNQERVANRFGDDAPYLLRIMKSLERDFFRSPACLDVRCDDFADRIRQMENKAKKDFLLLYPDVPTELLDALASHYSFNCR
jgi:hypothetical protein